MKRNYNLNKYCRKLALEEVNRLFAIMSDMKYTLAPIEFMLSKGEEEAKESEQAMERWKAAMGMIQVFRVRDILKMIDVINRVAGAEVFSVSEEELKALEHVPGVRRWEDPAWRAALLKLAERYHFLMSTPEGEPDVLM
ncbi:MAG: hypothetical protein IKM31_05520 [Oscillospiraceae bacterium]|nr:hypothetical protein [Oscillospiraceae bacterium]